MPRKMPTERNGKPKHIVKPWNTCGCCFDKRPSNGLNNPEKLHTCSKCGVKWHEGCAKGTNTDLCDVCKVDFLDAAPICVLCKKSDWRGFYKQSIGGGWGHLVCAKWSSTSFLNDESLIEGIGEIGMLSSKQNCIVCEDEGGELIQCVYGNCKKSVHAVCAKTSDAFLMVEVVWEKLAKNELRRYIEIMQIEDTSEVNRLWVPRFLYCSDHKKYYKSKDPFKHLLSTKKRKSNIRKRLRDLKTKVNKRKKPKVDKLVWDSKFYNGVKFLFVDY